jgi:vancomycin resistance protein VanJ
MRTLLRALVYGSFALALVASVGCLWPILFHGNGLVGLLYAPQAAYVGLAALGLLAAGFSRRLELWVLSVLASLMLVWGPGGRCAGKRLVGSTTPLTVLTQNIEGDDIKDAVLLAFLQSTRADLIVLQEVNYDRQFAICQTARPDLHWVRQPLGLGAEEPELAIGINLPVTSVHANGPALQPLLQIETSWNGQPLRIVDLRLQKSTHRHYKLPYLMETDAIQVAEAHNLLQALQASSITTILVGDFNCTPISPAFHLLTGWGLDALEHAGEGFCYTFPAPLPMWRIDGMLVTRDIRVLDANVLDPVGSDHRGVKFSLQRSSTIY